MSRHIFLDAPNIGGVEKKYLTKAVESGYVSTAGPLIDRFEEAFASYLGAGKAVSVQSGTSALHMALYELGIGPGDEVIVPALTFVATVNPVIYVGARPVFVDVDMKTWNIAPEKIRKNITGKTKAIIPVHFYGNPCNMDEIMDIAKKYHLYVIEDATESLGAKYKNKYTGMFGDFGCFSFNGNKIITTGGGGMITGKNRKSLKHVKFLINQAKYRLKEYYHTEIGFNYRMTNIEAALGLAQIEKLDKFLDIKRRFNAVYRKKIGVIKDVRFQENYDGAESSYWFSCIMFEREINIKALQDQLVKKGIPTRRIFMPMTQFPPYRRYKKSSLKNSYKIYKNGLCLPSSTLNSIEDIYHVCDTIKALLSKVF